MEDRAPIRVRFTVPHRAWGIGSDPILQAAEAEGLIALGVCELYDKPAAAEVSPVAPAVEPEPLEPEPVVVTDDANDNANDGENDGRSEPAGEPATSKTPPAHRQQRPRRSRKS